jgi:hypothetical protein
MPEDPEKLVNFDIVLEVEGRDHLSVSGQVGLIDDLPLSQSVISVGYGSRVITKTRDCYSSPDGSVRFDGTGVAGWIQLGDGWQPYLSTTKDAVNDQPVWDVLMAHVFTQIRPLLEKVQEDSFDLIFTDMAINLEVAFNSKSDANVVVQYAKAEAPGELPGSEGRGGDDSEPKSSHETGEDKKKEEPAICRVKIRRRTDDQMKTVLCRASILQDSHGQEFSVEVNQDHGTMQEAMKQRPVNRMALLAWIVAEIGKELVFHRDLLKRVVPKHVMTRLDDPDNNEREQGRIVTRLLLDRAAKAA